MSVSTMTEPLNMIVFVLVNGQTLNVDDPDGTLQKRMYAALETNGQIAWVSVSKDGRNYHAINMNNVLYFKFA
jgi:hypothetical protein